MIAQMQNDYVRISKRDFYAAVRREEARSGGYAFETPVSGEPPRVDWRLNGRLIGYVIKSTSVRSDDIYRIERGLA